MGVLSLAGFAAELTKRIEVMDELDHKMLEGAAKAVQKGAKEAIGHYQDGQGPFAEWAPLAPSTLAEKEHLGYAPPDNPLLREGDMRDSIEYTVHSDEAAVGSNSEVAVYQELGTEKIPPRSFLGGTAFRMKDQIGKMVGYGTYAALVGPKAKTEIGVMNALDYSDFGIKK